MKALPGPFKVGDYYIDCGSIPRVCLEIGCAVRTNRKGHRVLKQHDLKGRSLICGGIGYCSIFYCAPMKVDRVIAERWAKTGPLTKKEKEELKAYYAGEWGNGREPWWKE